MKLGALVWPQYTDWQSLRETGELVDRAGYDSLWTWDHLYPIVGDPEGPMFEGYLTLAGWAEHTENVRLGLMVGANTFRNPALVVKMITTLDHMSDGRMNLGIGGAWFETEHTAFGIEFGSGFGERLDWFDEAVELMRAMLPGGPASARGRFYRGEGRAEQPAARPGAPADHDRRQRRAEDAAHGRQVRRRLEHRRRPRAGQAQGRGAPPLVRRGRPRRVRDRADGAGRHADHPRHGRGGPEGRGGVGGAEHGCRDWRNSVDLQGPPELVAERWAPYLDLGFDHVYVDCPAPFDHETLERLATEVKPMLESR